MKIGFRIWILVICLALAALMISPTFKTGALVKSVEKNSTEFEQGIRQGMIIKEINSQKIQNAGDYSAAVSGLFESNETKKIEIKTDKEEFIFLSHEVPRITVDDVPKTKIKTGLDLSGGSRALVKAVDISLSDSQLQDLIAVTNQRLNTFGVLDVIVRGVGDLEGNNFMLVEVAGATPADLRELVGKQGKFEAKVGNKTVFGGGEEDVSSVCRNDASCAGITGCSPNADGTYACNFRFTIYLTERAAKKHADMTKNLTLDETGRYLSEKLFLYIDDNEVDSLLIGADLRGQVATQISIQGAGTGNIQEEALKDARSSMSKLQTILITGSLPYKLEIVKLDTISPYLGEEFTKRLAMLGGLVFLIVSTLILIRYRRIKVTLAVIMTMFSEVMITLGIAAFIGWNLDAPGIAGIIAGIGTGVNDQIVILDESIKGRGENSSLKERVKRALFIIFGAFVTIVAAMLPLFWAGAGLLKGFALTTIIGVSVGILITRPAFADIIRKIEGD